MTKQLTLIICVVMVALGGIFWLMSSDEPKSEPQQASQSGEQTKEKSEEIEETTDEPEVGVISGSLTYPGSQVPADLLACAEDSDGKEVACSDGQLNDEEKFIYGIGYEIKLPEGDYFVYAKSGDGNLKAYFNEYSSKITQDGEWPDYDDSKCSTSDAKKTVSVKSGQNVQNVTLGDWYFQTTCGQNQ